MATSYTPAQLASLASRYDPGSADYQMLMGLANNPAALNNPGVMDMVSSATSIPAMPSVTATLADGSQATVPYNAPPPAGATNLSYTASGSPGYAASAPTGSAIQAATPVANPASTWTPPAPAQTSLSGSGASQGFKPYGGATYYPNGRGEYTSGGDGSNQPNPRGAAYSTPDSSTPTADPTSRLRRPGGTTLGRGNLGISPARPVGTNQGAGDGGGTQIRSAGYDPGITYGSSGPSDQPYQPGGMTSVGGPGGPIQSGGSGYTPISINNPTQANFPAPNTPVGSPYNIPSSGSNSQFPTWNATPGGNGAGYQGGDPGYMASAEANRATDYGNLYENQYGSQYLQALGQENQYQGQADQSYADLAATPGYTSSEASAIQADPYSVNNVVNQTQQAMGSAIDPTKLGVSDQYVQQLKDQASRQIGLQYGSAEDQLQKQAEASGNVNPLALSAARDRLLRSQSIDSADALTNADIAATGAQRQANTNIANMRLGAATTIGGMGLNAGQYADTAASNRAANVAQQRIQGQQAARNYWQSQGQFQGGQANQATQARLSGAQTTLSGMGQGGQLAANTEIGRRQTRPVTLGTGGISIGL